uniref:Uncharacterized protein n=1 Tax=Avena sativa TaxID=4498 RepID=A0ACD5UIC1_AVESA
MGDLRSRCPVLPDEIMADEIFARLPAKSVVGCRCLSRSWAATLSSDDFIDSYHALHAGRPKIFRLQDESHGDVHQEQEARPCAPPTIMGFFPILAVTGDCFPSHITVFWDVTPALGPTHPILAATRCHGLVLLELVPAGIHFVYNPSTGQKQALPGSPRELLHKYASLGLGYDARARRHKVVRVYYRGCDSEGRPASTGCEVYVVNPRDEDSAGSWRPVSSRPAGWVERCRPSVFAQGHVYWIAHRKHDIHMGQHIREDKTIVYFSMIQETFGTVSPPPVMDDQALQKRCLTELRGRLCLFSGGSPGHEHRYDVWLLHRYESHTTWDLYFRIEAGTASPKVDRVLRSWRNIYDIDFLPLDVTDNGNILLARTDWPEDIWAYTPLTGNIEKLLDLKSLGHCLDILVVYPSLVVGATTLAGTDAQKAYVRLSELVYHDSN